MRQQHSAGLLGAVTLCSQRSGEHRGCHFRGGKETGRIGPSRAVQADVELEVDMLFLGSVCAQQARLRVMIKAQANIVLPEKSKRELIVRKGSSIKEEPTKATVRAMLVSTPTC